MLGNRLVSCDATLLPQLVHLAVLCLSARRDWVRCSLVISDCKVRTPDLFLLHLHLRDLCKLYGMLLELQRGARLADRVDPAEGKMA